MLQVIDLVISQNGEPSVSEGESYLRRSAFVQKTLVKLSEVRRKALNVVRSVLAPLGLALSEEKTKVTSYRKGYSKTLPRQSGVTG